MSQGEISVAVTAKVWAADFIADFYGIKGVLIASVRCPSSLSIFCPPVARLRHCDAGPAGDG